MVEFTIFDKIEISETPNFRDNFISALQCCENLKTLVLGPNVVVRKMIAGYEIFFHVVFPKLHHFQINFNQVVSSEFITHFLHSNTTIKSLCVINDLAKIDLDEVLIMRQLERLSLDGGITTNMHSIIPGLSQLSQLQYLKVCFEFRRNIFEALLKSIKNMPNLREIYISLPLIGEYEHDRLTYIQNEDLKRFKSLANLERLQIFSNFVCTNITLPGILEVLKQSPKWTTFTVNKFIQKISSDGSTLIDDEIYEKFRQAYYEKEHKDPLTWTYNCNADKYKIYSIGFQNHSDLFRRCLDYFNYS